MSDEKQTVPVKIIFGFQITRVTEGQGELVTTTYEPGQEVELETGIATEEEHRNRVRIVRPEPVAESAVREAEVRAQAEVPIDEQISEAPAEAQLEEVASAEVAVEEVASAPAEVVAEHPEVSSEPVES